MIFLDTETCGFHGPIVLVQYAYDDEEPVLYNVWLNPVRKTLALIEEIVYHDEGIVLFNAAFDWFHLCKLYTILKQFPDPSVEPYYYVNDFTVYEERGRFSNLCLKPKHVLDLMAFARKGPYQSTLKRKEIRVRRVPTVLAHRLARELDKIEIKDIYFSKKADPSKRWDVVDVTLDGKPVPEFKDLVLRFAPSSALKALAVDALNITDPLKLKDVKLQKPNEKGYAPYALSIGSPDNWNGAWPAHIYSHVHTWEFNDTARTYARDDVIYTRDLYHHFGKPDMDDDDSILACMIGATRWRGFALDISKLEAVRQSAIVRMRACPRCEGRGCGACEKLGRQKGVPNFNSHAVCQRYLEEVMSETEKCALKVDGKITTKAVVLEAVSKWKVAEVCEACNGAGCEKCKDGLIETDALHPAAIRAQEILDYRHAKKEMEILNKLKEAGRFHVSAEVIGTKSYRMSGSGGDLNSQGIKKQKSVREIFTWADGGEVLLGGDFDAFEVALMDAYFKDPNMRKELETLRPCERCDGAGCDACGGAGKTKTKIHGVFGMSLFKGKTYEEIMKSSGAGEDKDMYTKAKRGVFGMFYGGDENTLVKRLGVDKETASEAYADFMGRFPVFAEGRKKIFDQFRALRQPGGLGTKVMWTDPADYIESMFGFKRYFTLENMICKKLFSLAESMPKEWTTLEGKVTRRTDRGEQTVSGALRSALYAAAFNIQSGIMRAANNHTIQSSGASITKILQVRLWDLQPAGINYWRIRLAQMHDEVLAACAKVIVEDTKQVVSNFITEYRQHVPLLAFEWGEKQSWAG